MTTCRLGLSQASPGIVRGGQAVVAQLVDAANNGSAGISRETTVIRCPPPLPP
jgi:hypothetical protein